ncbi:DUF742 domain-containing protein [Streptomyces sp. B3I8]|uniref:DUF742 domain-containing protein n=1 Tax=Streptomyces sp. B3I8 TaxID=3042303 RepID=UPI002780CC7E|nr:DUF742 domain-containing protein [Streptomyces sp. B3I8]MDQ0786036.1 hypothetical protein [Streptomyces sp. B3I8]
MTPPQRRRRTPLEPSTPEPAPAAPAAGTEGEPAVPNPERLYSLTGTAAGAERASIDLVTLVVAAEDPPPTLTPEQVSLLRLCAAPLSVAEISAYLSLPFSVVTILLTELMAADLVQARAPIVRQIVPDRSLLEAVMHGLQKL